MKRGTVVLAPFPFTDLSGQKVRPAVVVSRSDRPGRDVMLAFITSYRGHPHKLVTVESAILLGELGELSVALLQQLDAKLRHALEL